MASSLTKESIEDKFKINLSNMVIFVEKLSKKLRNHGVNTIDDGKISMVKTGLSFVSGETIITKFIEKSHENFWDEIKGRNEQYFIDHSGDIFSDSVNSDLFREFFTNSIITNAEKNGIWGFFDAFVKLSIRYSQIVNCNVDIERHLKIWFK
jgi:hypothetical protein